MQLRLILRREAAKDNGKQVVGFGRNLILLRSVYGRVYMQVVGKGQGPLVLLSCLQLSFTNSAVKNEHLPLEL